MYYEFHIILQGQGDNPEDAWENAVEGFIQEPGIPDDEQVKIVEYPEDD